MRMNINQVCFCIGRNKEVGKGRKYLLNIMLDSCHLCFQKNSNLGKGTQGFSCVYMSLCVSFYFSLLSYLLLSSKHLPPPRPPYQHLCFQADDSTDFSASISSPVKEINNKNSLLSVYHVPDTKCFRYVTQFNN